MIYVLYVFDYDGLLVYHYNVYIIIVLYIMISNVSYDSAVSNIIIKLYISISI